MCRSLFAEHSCVWNMNWSLRYFGFGFENADLVMIKFCGDSIPKENRADRPLVGHLAVKNILIFFG